VASISTNDQAATEVARSSPSGGSNGQLGQDVGATDPADSSDAAAVPPVVIVEDVGSSDE
jgi:hypothetical protein